MSMVNDHKIIQMNHSEEDNIVAINTSSYSKEDSCNTGIPSGYLEDISNPSISMSQQDAQDLLTDLQADFDANRLSSLMKQAEKDILHAIVGPFGLGKILSAHDKIGGNVTTLHNFEKGVVATDQDEKRYAEWQDAKNKKVDRKGHNEAASEWKKKTYQKMSDGEAVEDDYTGKKIGEKKGNEINKTNGSIDVDHVTSVSEIEKDSKNHLFANGNDKEARKGDRVKMSSDDTNMALTNGSLNSSKGDKDLMDWANSPVSQDNSEKSGSPDRTNSEHYEVDQDKAANAYKRSKDKINSTQIINQFKKQGSEISVTGAREGVKTGSQQALGMLILEFMTQSFAEIKDLWNNGMETDYMIKELTVRVKRISLNLKKKWREAFKTFGEGFLSGFLSNLVTVAVNAFATTGKRVVRMIREGFFSLLKAIKILLFPPEDMTSSQAAHEALKIILGAGIVALGIFCEEALSKFIDMLPFANLIVAAIIGGLTAICTLLVAYCVDRVDFFKVVKIEGDKFILENLEQRISENTTYCDEMIKECDSLSNQLKQEMSFNT